MYNHDENYRLLGCKIVFYRKLQHMTQLELAEKVGMSSGYLSKIECGNYNKSISLSMLMSIAEGLNVQTWELLKFK